MSTAPEFPSDHFLDTWVPSASCVQSSPFVQKAEISMRESPRARALSAHSPVPSSVRDVGAAGAAGLYSVAGLNGLLTGLGCVFLGFFFSRPRLSRLPMTFSSPQMGTYGVTRNTPLKFMVAG
jgi:hypothetical protein